MNTRRETMIRAAELLTSAAAAIESEWPPATATWQLAQKCRLEAIELLALADLETEQ